MCSRETEMSPSTCSRKGEMSPLRLTSAAPRMRLTSAKRLTSTDLRARLMSGARLATREREMSPLRLTSAAPRMRLTSVTMLTSLASAASKTYLFDVSSRSHRSHFPLLGESRRARGLPKT